MLLLYSNKRYDILLQEYIKIIAQYNYYYKNGDLVKLRQTKNEVMAVRNEINLFRIKWLYNFSDYSSLYKYLYSFSYANNKWIVIYCSANDKVNTDLIKLFKYRLFL